MVTFDEAKGCYVVKLDIRRNGKRVRFRETLPTLVTREEALQYEAKLLAPPDPLEDLRKALEVAKLGPVQYGSIYAISNSGTPGAIKIGKTSRSVEDRIYTLQTATLHEWHVIECVHVTHMDAAEKAIHAFLARFRIHPRREFFEVLPYTAQCVLRLAGELMATY